MKQQEIKIALPKGRLLAETAALLEQAGWGLNEYREGTRSYRMKSQKPQRLFVKVFQEKDIPIQVAVGNYDLGICGLDWVEELLAKYPSSALVKLRDMGYGKGALYLVASKATPSPDIENLQAKRDIIRLASEYPNLAESVALDLRLRRFSVFPLWGGAGVYPPEDAELALLTDKNGETTFNNGQVVVRKVLDSSAYLIANRNSWESKDLSPALASLEDTLSHFQCHPVPANSAGDKAKAGKRHPARQEASGDSIRLALPDGHQQHPAADLLNKADIQFDDYPSTAENRRPNCS
ncbi:MAG: ATP phosphoribosyltransferase, partial [Chloroflexi bacterium]|nr:ATP phosphoribosyltransferase [Chloroflexota bacterium]